MGPRRRHREILRPARSRGHPEEARYLPGDGGIHPANSQGRNDGGRGLQFDRTRHPPRRAPEPPHRQYCPLRNGGRPHRGVSTTAGDKRRESPEEPPDHHLRRRLCHTARDQRRDRRITDIYYQLARPHGLEPQHGKNESVPHVGTSSGQIERLHVPRLRHPATPGRKIQKEALL